MKKVLLTSICRPIGPEHGDGVTVGYELLHSQVTRAQGIFSPRALHPHFALDYIAENLEAPCVVLQYPSRRELIRELRKGYDYVAVSFLLAVFHRMKEVVALVRKHAPHSRIILGGYGTVLPDDVLAPYADHVCREEGVAFMRRLLREPPLSMPYRHPMLVTRLKVLSAPVSNTGIVLAGLGCPNGCDFCCTSHFFKRRHIKLLPTGRDIFDVVERYLTVDPNMSFTVLDEDFLLDRRRAMEFRECVLRSGRTLSLFVFASVRALSRYTVEELLEMGIDGVWIGYEGSRAGFAKQKGRPVEEIFREFREHGITILASMIVGLPYQDEETVERELDELLDFRPVLSQFLIYGPTPGTPFYERVMEAGLLREDLASDPELYYRSCDGFTAMVRHPRLDASRIEALQRRCFKEDFQRLGPSIFRSVETWFLGYQRLRDSRNPALRRKARAFARDVRKAYAVLPVGRRLAPNTRIRRRIADLQRRIHRELGRPTRVERLRSVAAFGMAFWTALTLRLRLFQHPRLIRHRYRVPMRVPGPARLWKRIAKLDLPIHVEVMPEGTVWVRLVEELRPGDAGLLASKLGQALVKSRQQLVLDLKQVTWTDTEAAKRLAEGLAGFRARIRVLAPSSVACQRAAAAILAMFALH